MGILFGYADDKAQFERVWSKHINDLDTLARQAGCCQNDAYWAIKAQLQNMLQEAVSKNYNPPQEAP